MAFTCGGYCLEGLAALAENGGGEHVRWEQGQGGGETTVPFSQWHIGTLRNQRSNRGKNEVLRDLASGAHTFSVGMWHYHRHRLEIKANLVYATSCSI